MQFAQYFFTGPYKNQMYIQYCFPLSIPISSENTVQTLPNLSMSEMTSQHTNKAEIAASITYSQEQPPSGEHVPSNRHQIANLVNSSVLDETILNKNLLTGESSGTLYIYCAPN